MHYKNGRKAMGGDQVFDTENKCVGILHDLIAGQDTCNGFIAPNNARTLTTIGNCLHVDDIEAADIPNPEDTADAPPVE